MPNNRILLFFLAFATNAAQAKYGNLVDYEDTSSGGSGLIIFLAICVGVYFFYQHQEKARADRIAAREREDALREKLTALEKQQNHQNERQ